MSNTLIFVGNLTREAERKQTQGGALLAFSVAESVGWGDNKKTNFWNCALFGKKAEGEFIDYLQKGTKVKVVGEVSFNEKDGKSYNSVRVIDVELVGGKSDNQQPKPQNQAQGGYGQAQGGYGKPTQAPADLSDDLPF